MKIMFAPDSFKESMSAKEACEIMEKAWKSIFPESECIGIPMADGGEGTVHAMAEATGGILIEKEVQDPLGDPVVAQFAILGDGKTAVIEMAEASGIGLVEKDLRNPRITSTYGTGELILAALEKGVKNILIGIGGSATNDGGTGMLRALGAKFTDINGNDIEEGGEALKNLYKIDLTDALNKVKDINLIIASDVDNPLTGLNGASHIFGPQKGADPMTVEVLEEAMINFGEILERDIGVDINTPGAGAAGGLGAGLLALGAEIESGVDIVIKYTDLRNKIQGCDLVITGEGGIDSQTRYGKTPYGVAKTAKEFDIPVIAVAGFVRDDSRELYEYGFDALFSIMTGVSAREDALRQGPGNLYFTIENIARMMKIQRDLERK